MAKAPTQKKKSQKACLGNPLLPTKTSEKQVQITEALRQGLKNIYPPCITSMMVLSSLSVDEKAALLKSPKSERGPKIKSLKNSLRESKSVGLLPETLKNSFVIGLKQFLRELEKDNLCVVVFDNSVNFPAIRSVVDKGKVPVTGIQDLGKVLKEVIGFPGMVIAFKKNYDPHFVAIVSLIESEFKSLASPAPSLQAVAKPEKAKPEVVQPNQSKIELLIRTGKSCRVFRPKSSALTASGSSKQSKSDHLSSGFISFATSDDHSPSNGPYKSTVIKFV